MAATKSLTRRTLLAAGAAATAAYAFPVFAEAAKSLHVVKGVGCECCSAWVEHVRQAGFEVTEEERFGTLLIKYKLESRIPERLFSCHTGLVDRYFLEGHVPASDIRRLLEDRPEAIGLAVPGMPYGSPGMGSEDSREAYEVWLIRRDGSSEIYSSYPAA